MIPAFFRIFSLSDVVVNNRSKPMDSRFLSQQMGAGGFILFRVGNLLKNAAICGILRKTDGAGRLET